jgi:hypothetical protein
VALRVWVWREAILGIGGCATSGRIVGMRTLVLSRRRMNWKFDFSPETSDIVAVDERCYCWRREYNQMRGGKSKMFVDGA